jgi:hypothetical protein
MKTFAPPTIPGIIIRLWQFWLFVLIVLSFTGWGIWAVMKPVRHGDNVELLQGGDIVRSLKTK